MYKKTLHPWIRSHKVLLFVSLLAVIVAIVGIVSVVRAPASRDNSPGMVTKVGKVVCLPHKNSDGPQTLECASGLHGEDNKYYALKEEDSSAGPSPLNDVFDKRVEVSGTFVQTSDTIYDIAGTLTITRLKVIE